MTRSSGTDITIVQGFHKCTPDVAELRPVENWRRLAIVMEAADSEFRPALFCVLLDAVAAVLRADVTIFSYWDRFVIDSVDALRARFDVRKTEVPQRVLFRVDQTLVCVADVEPWAQIGGPEPYCDSYTCSFYTANDLQNAVLQSCRTALSHAGLHVSRTIVASPDPCPLRWWERILSI